MDLCLHCNCPATIEVLSGEQLCAACYDAAPLVPRPCPRCSQDATPVGLPVANPSDRPSDATDAGSPSPASVATISPVVVLPPESTTGETFTLADMVQALEWCVARAEDHGAPLSISAAADRGLTLLRHLERGYTKAVEG